MKRVIFLILAFAVMFSFYCDESSDDGFVCRRGDDGRELIYRGEESWVTWIDYPTLSPDASEVAFNARLSSEYTRQGIIILNLRTSETRVLMEEDGYWPRWSPSGDWIAFSTYMGPGTLYNVYLIRPDGTVLRPAVSSTDPFNNTAEAWFNEKDRLIVYSYTGFEQVVLVYDVLSDTYEEVWSFGDVLNCVTAAVSPCDEWVALTQWPRGNGPDLLLAYLRSDWTDYRVEIRDRDIFGQVEDWSPDGVYILFSLMVIGSEYLDTELWTYDTKTGAFEQLTAAPEGFSIPGYPQVKYETVQGAEWGPDGYIYFAANNNLYRIKAPE
jgi:Tol biopolymer transport system component